MEGVRLILRWRVILVTLVLYVKLAILKEQSGDRSMVNRVITHALHVRQSGRIP